MAKLHAIAAIAGQSTEVMGQEPTISPVLEISFSLPRLSPGENRSSNQRASNNRPHLALLLGHHSASTIHSQQVGQKALWDAGR